MIPNPESSRRFSRYRVARPWAVDVRSGSAASPKSFVVPRVSASSRLLFSVPVNFISHCKMEMCSTATRD